jgi:hypothetical protein
MFGSSSYSGTVGECRASAPSTELLHPKSLPEIKGDFWKYFSYHRIWRFAGYHSSIYLSTLFYQYLWLGRHRVTGGIRPYFGGFVPSPQGVLKSKSDTNVCSLFVDGYKVFPKLKCSRIMTRHAWQFFLFQTSSSPKALNWVSRTMTCTPYHPASSTILKPATIDRPLPNMLSPAESVPTIVTGTVHASFA